LGMGVGSALLPNTCTQMGIIIPAFYHFRPRGIYDTYP
jgi:hypothetical protein